MKDRDIIEALRSRKNTGAYGLRTADAYVANGIAAGGLKYPDDDNAMLKDAENRLVYAQRDADIDCCKATATKRIKEILGGVPMPKHTAMAIAHTLTTSSEDRDGDILETEGAILDPKAPLLWQHMPAVPIGKIVRTIEQTKNILRVASVIIDLNDLTADAVKLFEAEVLRFSHGFRALDAEPLETGKGEMPRFRFTSFEIMEGSAVSVPSNTEAEPEIWSAVKGLQSDHFRHVQEGILKTAQTQHVKGVDIGKNGEITVNVVVETKTAESTKQVSDEMPASRKQYQPEGSKQFRPEGEYLEASKLEYEWASRYIGCEVKNLQVIETMIPQWRKGSWFVQLQQLQNNDWDLSDTRNITNDGRETPPRREVVQLNSKGSDTFLIDGIEFWNTPHGKMCVKHQPGRWDGRAYVTFYAADDSGGDVMSKCWTGAIEQNLLKGEAFALSGDFLEDSGESFDDVFLTEKNILAVSKASRRLNNGGSDTENRGQIYLGEPGTGKTLSGRCLMNSTDATFIWVSAKDFWNFGTLGAISTAFDMAKELAPTVLFFEDVDNWIDNRSIDMLKTEMDGIGQSKGLLTILTTNYPERMPAALIDRPGRFDDILKFDLPTEGIRIQMLTRWVPEANEAAIKETAKKTAGYSGAHIYYVAQHAKSILVDGEATDISTALGKAMSTLNEQREMIDDDQLSGSRYKPRTASLSDESKSYLEGHEFVTKAGMTKPEKKKLDDSVVDLKAMLDVSGLKTGDKSLVRGSLLALKPLIGDKPEEEKKDGQGHLITFEDLDNAVQNSQEEDFKNGIFPDAIKAVNKKQRKAIGTVVKNMDAILGQPKDDVPRTARSLGKSVKTRLQPMGATNPGVTGEPNPNMELAGDKPKDDKPKDDKPKEPATIGEHLAAIALQDPEELVRSIAALQTIADANADDELAKTFREFEANETANDTLLVTS